jgi:paraquat-inducible protein B
MSKPANKTLIGFFVVVALALVVAAVLVLGSGKFFKNYPGVVMYFQGSVKGLSVGAPVNFRGVKVGAVTDIKMLINPKDLSVMIPVYAELYPDAVEMVGGVAALDEFGKAHGRGELIPELIKRGMRAQLEMQSVVTGQLQVSLDIYPDKPAVFVHADPKTQEIPTIPTPLQELAKRVEKIPIEEIFTKMNEAMTGIEKIINSAETAGTLKAIKQGVDEARGLIQDIDHQVGPLGDKMADIATHINGLAEKLEARIGPLTESVTKTSDEAGATLKKAQGTLETIDYLAGEDSVVSYRLDKTLEELSAAARSLRLLADTLQQQPDAIIFGKKNTGGK